MNKFWCSLISILLLGNVFSQKCNNTFESNYLKLSICNDLNWEIEQTLPYIKIKTQDVATFITIYSEKYTGNESTKELAEKSFISDKTIKPNIEKLKVEDIAIDGVIGTFYIAKSKNKESQTSTYIIVNKGLLYTINNNCYTECSKAEQAIKSVISHINFQKFEEPKLTNKEIKDLKLFKENLHYAFKSKKKKSFEKLLVTQQLMIELVDTKVKDETMKKRFRSIMETEWEGFSKEFIDDCKDSFSKIITKGEALGINWKKIEFIDLDYKLINSIPGVFSAECNYTFSFQGKSYQITINSVEPLKSGWFISKLNSSYIKEI